MSFQDKILECFDCEESFTFSAEEQEQFKSRGYTNEPKRCPECRQSRRAKQNRFDGNSYGNSNYRYTTQRKMFPAVCHDCGKDTTVPFEPRQGRPVYCNDCYRKVRVGR